MIDIKLYDRNLTTPVLIAHLTERIQGMRFGTKIPGGFSMCSFRLNAQWPEIYDWLTQRLGYRLVISDLQDVIWEGRIEDVEFQGASNCQVTAFGYYSNLGDVPYSVAYADVTSEVIKDVLTANCLQINADQTHIAAMDVGVDSSAGEDWYNLYPQVLFAKLLAVSDTTHAIWDFAIWEDRIPYLVARNVTAVDWYIDLEDTNQFALRNSLNRLWNSCYAIAHTGGVYGVTSTASDADSQTHYGLNRCWAIPDLQDVTAASAEACRDAFLAANKDIWPIFTRPPIIGQWIYDATGTRYSPYRIRAGDVLRIRNLVPATVILDSVTRDAISTFFITETDYDTDRGEMSLLFETKSLNLEAILVRIVPQTVGPTGLYF